ncbi:adenylyltransferase/cytidyltransferase family protein [Paenibacillus radicis (ex Gao et al. 2016)]|uniref:Cytidyltransferase-like domain-containing protein n=1 Tax=Paenibacillus radicis (ex Gao et al. 2016) TaxID=1737354 RepID=A0A917GN76_9BACL|nr:adenylyltransferase/cytidyltransferase family protein [Paenibacillus radicis (ex Gao et al. 2016)]GGG52409.1 hypothetical protein GCM10010918_01390 [Paenibacillus radicis (ex Gao et al. 2016)]
MEKEQGQGQGQKPLPMEGKAFRYGFVLGRFQHVHAGHELMIDTALNVCDKVLVLVGSAQLEGTLRNPYSAGVRIDLLRRLYGSRIELAMLPDYSHENDHSHAWGKYLLKAARDYGRERGYHELDLMVYGSDEERAAWFSKEELNGVAQLALPRNRQPISATRLREALVQDDRKFWQQHMNEALHSEYDRLRALLLQTPEYQVQVK